MSGNSIENRDRVRSFKDGVVELEPVALRAFAVEYKEQKLPVQF